MSNGIGGLARRRERRPPAQRVQNVARLEPRLARDSDAELHVVESGRGMCVGADLDRYPHRLGSPQIAPIEVEPMRIGVQLDRHAHLARLLEHRVEVQS